MFSIFPHAGKASRTSTSEVLDGSLRIAELSAAKVFLPAMSSSK
jgi:hypothetical protein